MPDTGILKEFLDGARVDAAVFSLRPDYRALLLAVGGLVPGPGDQASEALLQALELAPGPPHPAARRHHHGAVHPGRARTGDRRGTVRGG